jgi:hypothetical protein
MLKVWVTSKETCYLMSSEVSPRIYGENEQSWKNPEKSFNPDLLGTNLATMICMNWGRSPLPKCWLLYVYVTVYLSIRLLISTFHSLVIVNCAGMHMDIQIFFKILLSNI